MINIEELTVEELWKELKTRFTNCVLLYEQEAPGKIDSNQCWNSMYYSGSYATILGLCSFGDIQVRDMINDTFIKGEEPDG